MRQAMRNLFGTSSLALASLVGGCGTVLDMPKTTAPFVEGIQDPSWVTPAAYVNSDAPAVLGRSGLAVSADGKTALIADPDDNRLLFARLPSGPVASIPLDVPGSAPLRPVRDASGTFYVALANAGRVVSVRPDGSRGPWGPVCPQPSSLAIDEADGLWVACSRGQVMRLERAGDRLSVDRVLSSPLSQVADLQIVQGELWLASTRSATVARLTRDGKTVSVLRPGDYQAGSLPMVPAGVSRMIKLGDTRLLMAYTQRVSPTTLKTPPYYGPPIPIMPFWTTLSSKEQQVGIGVTPGEATGPQDLALSENGTSLLAIAIGNVPMPGKTSPEAGRPPAYVASVGADGTLGSVRPLRPKLASGKALYPLALAPLGSDQFLLVADMPAALHTLRADGTIVSSLPLPESRLPAAQREARTAFYTGNARGLTCESCHSQGGEDGHLWSTPNSSEKLRTMSLFGLASRSSFRWDGSESSLPELIESDMSRFGNTIRPELAANIATFLRSQRPAWSPPVSRREAELAARGAELFASHCSTCHSGDAMTNGQTAKVRGKELVVPSLLQAWKRAPYGHDGRALTLSAFLQDATDTDHYVPEASRRDALVTYVDHL